MKRKHFAAFAGIAVGGLSAVFLLAAPQSDKTDAKSDSQTEQRETVAKPMTAKQKKKQEAKLRKELETPYKKWLNEDVGYIITDEERKAFKRLSTDDEREQFIEQFWLRRDPTPDTEENEFKEEHYRRIAYANEHFASGIPGWKTDRGRIYIVYGPPDEIESHPSGGTYDRPIEEGGGTTSTYPFEDWRYRYIEGMGSNIMIEFVDTTMSGEYRMTMDPSEKDALTYVPGAGLTLYEQMGMADKSAAFYPHRRNAPRHRQHAVPASMDEFERLAQFAKLQKAPQVKFKDLEAAVSSSIRYNTLPFKVRADYIKITDSTVLTTITFNSSDGPAVPAEGQRRQSHHQHLRPHHLDHWPRGEHVRRSGDHRRCPPTCWPKALDGASIYQKEIPLAPGMYRLNVVCKDIVGGNMTTYPMALTVPHFDDEKLASSSLILADVIEKVPTRSIGTGQFVIGDTKVRPRLTDTFARNEKLGIYTQFYNFSPDEKTKKPNGSIQYEITKSGATSPVLNYTEEVTSIPGASSQQVTVEKLLPLQSLEPGNTP